MPLVLGCRVNEPVLRALSGCAGGESLNLRPSVCGRFLTNTSPYMWAATGVRPGRLPLCRRSCPVSTRPPSPRTHTHTLTVDFVFSAVPCLAGVWYA